ncbi:MAG: aryl-sulfate sulfotransferase [Promethearchaeota archaeon]
MTALNEEKACSGYVLYSPPHSNTTYLIDINGAMVHQWKLPYVPGCYGYLLPNNHLFYSGKVRDKAWDIFEVWHNFKGGAILEVDWEGKVLWEHRDIYHHHDSRCTPSGNAVYLSLERVPEEVAAKVKGGIPGSEEAGMWADLIVEVDREGNRIWEWHAYEHLDPETDVLPPNFSREEWSHGNTIVPIGDDRVMVSFRSISTVGIVDKKSGNFVWKLGHDVLAQQHDPSVLPNGNILIFDNGLFRKKASRTYSRVIEVNPNTNDIVWEYRELPFYNFYSPHISGARRLPNGNTLITEGAFGRMFQVTSECEVVWEYINPYFNEGFDGSWSNSVFRANHYMADQIIHLD